MSASTLLFEGLPDVGGLGPEEAMELLRGLPRDRLSLVKGWRTDRLSLGPRGSWAALENLPPLILVNASLHGYALSPAALPCIEALWPEFAREGANPVSSAQWGERNLPRLFVFYGRVAGLDEGKLRSFMDSMARLGVGSLEDMTLSGEEALELMSSPPCEGRIRAWATPEVYRGSRRGPESCAQASRSSSTGLSERGAPPSMSPSREGKKELSSGRTSL